jgi:hypothetical protein
MTSTKGDQTMRKPKENVKEIALSKQLIKEKPALRKRRDGPLGVCDRPEPDERNVLQQHEAPVRRAEGAEMSEMQALAEELREYTAMKYAGDCKCGKCQLVPRALVERIYHTLNGSSVRCSAVSAEYQRCMDMLGDVPGPTLEDRLTRYIGCYMALQIKAGAQPQASVESAEASLQARGLLSAPQM